MSKGIVRVLSRGDHFFFSEEGIVESGRGLKDRYLTAQPFPHIVLDDFLPATFAAALHDAFPPAHLASVNRSDEHQNLKRGFRPDDLGDAASRAYVQPFGSRPFLLFLESLTGIEGLIPDPYYVGGGYQETLAGGSLAIHADFNLHPRLNLIRRINVLLYLNREWDPEYGGNLELWDAAAERCVTSIAPIFNRCVVFNTTPSSFHGHPEPLNCPEHRSRQSIALYYYTARTETMETEPINPRTDWRRRPQDSRVSRLGRLLRSVLRNRR
jgi:Rps23 Pro-64 3,4-dihydroxylase Tpa1-like proline 4-hydroxylase